jgi:hypothetical protein
MRLSVREHGKFLQIYTALEEARSASHQENGLYELYDSMIKTIESLPGEYIPDSRIDSLLDVRGLIVDRLDGEEELEIELRELITDVDRQISAIEEE